MIAVEHVVLAAIALEYGTCWLVAFDEEQVKRILKISRRFNVIALLPIGKPAEFPEPQPKKGNSGDCFRRRVRKTIRSISSLEKNLKILVC